MFDSLRLHMADKVTETLILNGERVAKDDMVRFWRERPDPDFSEERNKAVIARSIARAEAHRKAMRKLQMDGLAERTDALATYVKARVGGKTHKTAEQYFGRKEIARLQGKKVIQMLQKAKETGQPYWRVISNHEVRGYK